MGLQGNFSAFQYEAGCDEAGRGCLAGPVFAAAVILPPRFDHPLLNDSKKLTPSQRYSARSVIEENALACAVASVDNDEIDEKNILWASLHAMHLALDKLTVRPEFIIIDGNRFKPYGGLPFKCIVKGDALYLSIAAASYWQNIQDDFMMKQCTVPLVWMEYQQRLSYAPSCQDHP